MPKDKKIEDDYIMLSDCCEAPVKAIYGGRAIYTCRKCGKECSLMDGDIAFFAPDAMEFEQAPSRRLDVWFGIQLLINLILFFGLIILLGCGVIFIFLHL